jgi:hypothetical protein
MGSLWVPEATNPSYIPGEDYMSAESTLRAQARSLMEAEKVPNRPPDRIWGGPGVGTPCMVCGARVKSNEAELEVEWCDGTSTTNQHFHTRCFAALEAEIREREPAERPFGTGAQLESGSAAFIAEADKGLS